MCKALHGAKLPLVASPDPGNFCGELAAKAESDAKFCKKLHDAIGQDFRSQFGQVVTFVVENWDDDRLKAQLPEDAEVIGWINAETDSWQDSQWKDLRTLVEAEMVRVARVVYLFTNIWRLRRMVRLLDENRLTAIRDFPAVDFDAVLDEELEEIGKLRSEPCDSSGQPAARADQADLTGLAFSGGGIRSATFNLGVLQHLGDRGLLKKFDYLSTVSGGGYIGSWLQAWIHRAGREGQSIDAVQDSLGAPDSQDERAAPVRFLRRYSNYLTPRKGIQSADTWTMIGIWMRNAFLNALVIAVALAALVAIPYWLAEGAQWMNDDLYLSYWWWMPVVPAAILIGRRLSQIEPQNNDGRLKKWLSSERGILALIVLPVFLAAWAGGTIVPAKIRSQVAAENASKAALETTAQEREGAGDREAASKAWADLVGIASKDGDDSARDRYEQKLLQLIESVATDSESAGDTVAAAQQWARVAAVARRLGDQDELKRADGELSRLLRLRRGISREAMNLPGWFIDLPVRMASVKDAKPPSIKAVLGDDVYLNNSSLFGGVCFAMVLIISLLGRVDRTYDAGQQGTVWSISFWVWLPISGAIAFFLAVMAFEMGVLTDLAVLGLLVLCSGPLLKRRGYRVWRFVRVWWSILCVCLLAGAASGLADDVWLKYVMTNLPKDAVNDLPLKALALSAPAFFCMIAIAFFIYMGLLGRGFPDDRREWMARLGAWVAIFCLVSSGVCGVAAFGPALLVKAAAWLNLKFGGGSGIKVVSALIAAAGALSTKASSDAQKGTLGATWRSKAIAALAPPAFIFGLLAALATGLSMGLKHMAPGDNSGQGGIALAITLGGFGLALFLSSRIDVNEFSLHEFYRNRLVRCYLGGARASSRRPNAFTGFDTEDDVRLTALAPSAGHTGPYPILNTTLNVASGEELAWQERKGAAFVFTPRYCGFDAGRGSATHSRAEGQTKLSGGGYRPTEDYAYPDPNRANGNRTESGVLLGTAMAISGAAASPAMGNKTSTSLAFLMTVMDVRLGWWLGNPRRVDTWQRSGPSTGLFQLLTELTARTSDTGRYVYLTDGGHFENLGIYELVRRRCRFIVACDSEEDREYTFGGLGNAIRRCRSDFGVDIDIDVRSIKPKPEKRYSEAHCAIGTIQYPGSDGNPGPVGTLLYIKSSLRGEEPSDILQYSLIEPDFPHESTADQWFDESHFESYRTLGYHVAKSSLETLRKSGNLSKVHGERFRGAVRVKVDEVEEAAVPAGTAQDS